MAVLLRSKSSRGIHPPVGAGLDLGHPLVQGLHLYAPFNELGGQTAQDLRRGNHLRPATGTAAWSPRGLACPSDGSLRLETARNIGISGNQKLTYGAWFLTGAETGLAAISHHVFNIGVATNDNMSHLILLKPTSDDTLWIPKYGAWGFDNNANTGIRDGKPHLVVIVYDGTKYLCYIDGHLDATSSAYSTLNITDATMAFGQYRGGGSTFGYQGRAWGAFVATRAWSQSDVEWLYTEPYAFIQPQSPSRRFWVVPAGTLYTQNLAGTITPTGAPSKTTSKPLTATITPTGAIAKTKSKSTAGSVTPVGTVAKTVARALIGLVTPSGLAAKTVGKSTAGSVAPAGADTNTTGKSLTGLVTPDGQIVRSAAKGLAGTVTPSGTPSKTTSKSLDGTVTPTGVLTAFRTLFLAVAGTIAPNGTLTRSTSKQLAASITPAGSIAKTTAKHLTGTTTPSGSIRKTILRTLAGLINPTGTLTATSGILRDITVTFGRLSRRFAAAVLGRRYRSAVLARRYDPKDLTR